MADNKIQDNIKLKLLFRVVTQLNTQPIGYSTMNRKSSMHLGMLLMQVGNIFEKY